VQSLTGTLFHVYDTTDSRTGKKCQETVYTVTMSLNSLFFCDQKKKKCLWTFYFCSTNHFPQWKLSFCYCNKIMYLVLLFHLHMNWDSIAYKKFPEIRMDPFGWFETGFLSL